MSLSDDDRDANTGHERWIVSYADFITLLFAFFAVLYATSNRDMEKTKQFQDSIKRFLIKTGAFGGTGETVNQGEKYNSPIEPPIPTFAQGTEAAREILDQVEQLVERDVPQGEKSKYLRDIGVDENGARVQLSASQIFAKNSAKFLPAAIPFLDRLAALIEGVGRPVMIEGHMPQSAANNPNYPSAWEFASARSAALVRYFVKRHNLDASRFIVVSHGAQRPIVPNEKSDAQLVNQRIEILFLSEDSRF